MSLACIKSRKRLHNGWHKFLQTHMGYHSMTFGGCGLSWSSKNSDVCCNRPDSSSTPVSSGQGPTCPEIGACLQERLEGGVNLKSIASVTAWYPVWELGQQNAFSRISLADANDRLAPTTHHRPVNPLVVCLWHVISCHSFSSWLSHTDGLWARGGDWKPVSSTFLTYLEDRMVEQEVR